MCFIGSGNFFKLSLVGTVEMQAAKYKEWEKKKENR